MPKHQRNESNRMQRIIYKIKRYVSRKIGNVLNFQWWGCKENINISQVGPETFHSKQIFLNIFIDHLKDSKGVLRWRSNATGFAWHSNANVYLKELAGFWLGYWQPSLTMKKKGTQLTRSQFCCLILFSTKLSIRKYLYRLYFVNHCSCISLMIWNHPNNDKLIFCIVISFNHSR